MANLLRCSTRIGCSLLRTSGLKLVPVSSSVPSHDLFTNEYLGIEQFVANRERVSSQFGPMRDKFFERMRDSMVAIERGEDKLVFTEDLKNITYLATNSQEDVDLLIGMLKKFNTQNKDMRFGSFIFGPVIARLLHLFKLPELTESLLKEPDLFEFFNQLSSFSVSMDLLYESGKYQEVLDLFNVFKQSGSFETRFPRDLIALVIASAFKLNTPEAYKFSKELVTNARKSGAFLSSRAVSFFSAFALRQNEPDVAYECLSVLRRFPPLARNLRIMTLCDMKRPDDALISLRGYLSEPNPRKGQDIFPETIEHLKAAVKQFGDSEVASDFDNVVKALNEANHVYSGPRKLDDFLVEPITMIKRDPVSQQMQRGYSDQNDYDARRNQTFRPRAGYNFNPRTQPGAGQSFARKGLSEMD